MVDRRTVGSWLDGPAATNREEGDYPGRRLGLPEQGSGSVAGFGRRLLALGLDWALALLISRGLFTGGEWTTLGVFAVMQAALVATMGAGVGHVVLRMRVVRLDGSSAGPLRALVRAGLLSLAVPALVWDRDQRGMHDRLTGMVLRRV